MPAAAMTPRRRRPLEPRRARRGFTLTEMMIALALLGIVGAAMVTVVVQQNRFYRGAMDVLRIRSGMRQATGILPVDLRGSSSVGGDLYAISDRMLEFRANTGSSIICSKPNNVTLILPPTSLAKGNALTAWLNQPSVGDSILVYNDSTDVGTADDAWMAYEIASVTPVPGGCLPASGYTQVADALASSYQITIVPAPSPLSTNIIVGAPVRFFRRVHYELFQANDRNWYLGWYDCLKGRLPQCSTLQPVSGPYRAYSIVAGNSGLSLLYYDQNGVLLDPTIAANRSRVARIELTLRGQATQASYMPGRRKGTPAFDSLSTIIGLRNRS